MNRHEFLVGAMTLPGAFFVDDLEWTEDPKLHEKSRRP
jgi:hypothetical protein